ncbi:hypothetical protein QR680_001158 [Steinernema hermaphroditum]|uniref:MKRN2 opposite strand protein-like C-terminal domain-containing protein n=1 Tax=Steinernema hermaphroditum TaxID=289476 RepID=A0AA39LFF9_9BILA|nr:hypothetical protein QR680_001158 [Steinernema hermaphroditum]
MSLVYVSHKGCSRRFVALVPLPKSMVCSSCHRSLMDNDISLCITHIPSPFAKQCSVVCSVVIKPTFGSFLSYKTGQNLHIGIADSHSVVHSFSGSGVLSESSTWDMSLVVCRFDVASMDEMMRLFMSDHAHYFSKDSYRETDWNCFDFVIHFLSFAKLGRYSKAVFTQLFVLDIMKCARRYAKLFKRVMRRGPLTVRD